MQESSHTTDITSSTLGSRMTSNTMLWRDSSLRSCRKANPHLHLLRLQKTYRSFQRTSLSLMISPSSLIAKSTRLHQFSQTATSPTAMTTIQLIHSTLSLMSQSTVDYFSSTADSIMTAEYKHIPFDKKEIETSIVSQSTTTTTEKICKMWNSYSKLYKSIH